MITKVYQHGMCVRNTRDEHLDGGIHEERYAVDAWERMTFAGFNMLALQKSYQIRQFRRDMIFPRF